MTAFVHVIILLLTFGKFWLLSVTFWLLWPLVDTLWSRGQRGSSQARLAGAEGVDDAVSSDAQWLAAAQQDGSHDYDDLTEINGQYSIDLWGS